MTSQEELQAVEWIESLGFKRKPLKHINMWTLDGQFVTLENVIFFKSLITAHTAEAVKEAEIKAYNEGYESGRNETPPKLVDDIEFRRDQYGWSKGKMAQMLDMTKGNYSEFIHGTRNLPINSIRKAYAIGIPAKVLLQDDIDQLSTSKSNGNLVKGAK